MKNTNLMIISLIAVVALGITGVYASSNAKKQTPLEQNSSSISSNKTSISTSSSNQSSITKESSVDTNKSFLSISSSNQSSIAKQSSKNSISENSVSTQSSSVPKNIADSTARVSGDFVATNFKTTGVNIWKGVGLEPRFSLNINYDQVADNYPTELAFQNDGTVNGYLQLKSINGGAIMEYEGKLMVGGDGAVPANIKINMFTECTKPNGQITMNTVNIKFGDNQYKGCADWIGNGKSLLSPNKQAEIKKSFMEVPGIKSVNFTDKGVKVVGEIDEPAAGLAMKKSDDFKILLDGSEFSLKK
jgi:hypothetical protein